jgi:glycine/D-amino acid oxidase-like deaminating enzyme
MTTHAISVWEQESFFKRQDIIIIGAGLVGLWAALELIYVKPDLKITILERGIIPTGASTRNAGFACFGSPTEMLADVKRMQENEMWSVVEMRYKGIEKIKKHFSSDTIDLDICGGYECLSNKKSDPSELRSAIGWLNKGMQQITGTEEAFTFSNDKLSEYGLKGFDSLVENKLEGGLHSGKLVKALLQKVHTMGVTVITGAPVSGWAKTRDVIEIHTPYFTMETEQLIVCTNAAISQLLKNANIEPARGQVLITAPVEGLRLKGTFHYDEGYYYFRNLGNRILIGGARNLAFDEERTNELVLNNNIQIELERFIATHILNGQPFEIANRWSGIMGFTESKLPIIKKMEEGIFVAIACNGMGVALSPIVAEKVAALALN